MASIRKRSGKYHVQVRRQGFPTQTKSFLQLKDAKEWARLKEIEADRGELSNDHRQLQEKTFGDLVQSYLEKITPYKKTSEAETYVLSALQKNAICKVSLRALSTSHFASYRDQRLKHISAAGLARELNTIRHMLNIAKIELDIPLTHNPLNGLRVDFKDNRRERRLKDGEQEKLLEAARTRQNPLIEKVVIFAIETGMRRGEILGLHWDQVDLKRRSVTILESKNGYSRTIPLTPGAFGLLQSMKDEAGDKDLKPERVFPVTANALRMAWERMLARTDIKELHFHDLRHDAISRFFEMGLTVPEVASISGHRDMKMLMRYAHADAKNLAKKLEAAE